MTETDAITALVLRVDALESALHKLTDLVDLHRREANDRGQRRDDLTRRLDALTAVVQRRADEVAKAIIDATEAKRMATDAIGVVDSMRGDLIVHMSKIARSIDELRSNDEVQFSDLGSIKASLKMLADGTTELVEDHRYRARKKAEEKERLDSIDRWTKLGVAAVALLAALWAVFVFGVHHAR